MKTLRNIQQTKLWTARAFAPTRLCPVLTYVFLLGALHGHSKTHENTNWNFALGCLSIRLESIMPSSDLRVLRRKHCPTNRKHCKTHKKLSLECLTIRFKSTVSRSDLIIFFRNRYAATRKRWNIKRKPSSGVSKRSMRIESDKF